MSSVFDAELFLDATTTEALERRPPLPAGMDFIGTLGEPKMRKGQKDGKDWTACDFIIEIDLASYPDVQKQVNAAKVMVKYGFIFDLNEGGMVDWSIGKNNRLRRLREAVGMNVPGQTFSIRQMQGRQVRVKIKHREFEGEMFEEIDSIAKP
jgi:hypothetical protein